MLLLSRLTPRKPRPLLVAALLLGCGTSLAATPSPRRSLTPDELREPAPSAERAARFAAVLADRKPQPETAPTSFVPCVGGLAGVYPCNNVDLESFLPNSAMGGGTASGLWGWTDPLTGKEYALAGLSSGTAFVDISNPASPVYLGRLPTHTVSSGWRDLKVYRNHVFVVSEANGHGLQVFDLTRLRGVTSPPPISFTEDAYYGSFGHAHTLLLDEDSGFAFAAGSNTCSGGLHMIDVRDPLAPVFAGCFSDDDYTHDGQCVTYRGPDSGNFGREICFACNADTLTIVDVTDKAAPVQLSRTDYPGRRYTHQGWLTEDHAYFLLNDEGDETGLNVNTTTHIWDVRSLAAPVRFATFVSTLRAIDHNLFIAGRLAYESNYRAGLRILDVNCVADGDLTEVGYFDVYPASNSARFDGSWSNYPYYASGVVAVNGIEEGLFIVRPRLTLTGPVASAADRMTACNGATVTLDGSGSTACDAAGLRYRWLDGTTEVCPWSTSPTCPVTPTSSRQYTLEVQCASGVGCTARGHTAVFVGTTLPGQAGPDVSLCAGAETTLAGSASGTCPSGTLQYRWLAGPVEVCPWSDSPTCDVTPATTTAYTFETSCDASVACASRDTLTATVVPDFPPGSLLNSLRAVRSGGNVVLSWGTDPLAVTYALYRSMDDRRSWPPAPYQRGLPLPSSTLSDVAWPPLLYTYRVVGESCSGIEGL